MKNQKISHLNGKNACLREKFRTINKNLLKIRELKIKYFLY
jgi:hypothetical protein